MSYGLRVTVPEIYRIVDKKVHQFAQASRGWYSWPKQSSGNFGGDHLAIWLYALINTHTN
jgi:hypothetical protein